MASITLDGTQFVIALGAVQGLVLTAALAAQRQNRTANRWLAALMASFTLYLASSIYYATGLFQAYPHFFGVSYPLPWVFGPLVYVYARAASDSTWRVRPRDALHFVPFAVSVLIAAPYFVLSGPDKVATLERFITQGVPAHMAVYDPTKYVTGIGYSVATVLLLRRHRHRVEQSYSNTERVNLRWLMLLVGAACATWLLATTLRISDFGELLRDEHVSLAVAVIVYATGYIGLRQPEVLRHETLEYPVPARAAASPSVPPAATPVAPPVDPPRYERSGMSDAEAEQLKKSLLALMDKEHPWKDSELTLSDLARRLSTSPHKLSEVLNSQVNSTFYDFVNGYRVREVQRRIKAGDARSLKILALALDAGFASKSTFNDVFKKQTNHTPSGYRQAVGA